MKEYIMSFINNEWVVGIGTGLIGSFIVAVFSLILQKTRKKAKYKKAHENCVEVLLKYIDKNGIPSESVILSIINVIADKFKLDPKKFNVKLISDDLLLHLIQQDKYSSVKTKKFLTAIEETTSNINVMRIDTTEILSDDEQLLSTINDILVRDLDFDMKKYDILSVISNILVFVVSSGITYIFSTKALIIFTITLWAVMGAFILISRMKKK